MFKWLRSLFAPSDEMARSVRELEEATERLLQSTRCVEKVGIILDGVLRRMDGEPWEAVHADMTKRLAAVK